MGDQTGRRTATPHTTVQNHDTAKPPPGKRTGVPGGGGTAGPTGAPKGNEWEIQRNAPATVVGEPAIFSVPGAEKHTKPGERYVCWWTIKFDEAAAKAKGLGPEDTRHPNQRLNLGYITVNFEIPGTHKVVCEVKWEGAGKPPAEAAYTLETTVVTRHLADISKDAHANFENLDNLRLVATTIGDKRDPKAAAEHEKLAGELKGKITGGKEVPLKAVLTGGKSGASVALSMVMGPSEKVVTTGQGKTLRHPQFTLIDLTRGVKRMEYAGATAKEALADFRSGNSYPEGLLELEVPPNEHGIPAERMTIETTGKSNMEEWAQALGLVAMGLSGAATFFTGGLAAPLFVWASTATAAIGSAITLADHLTHAKLETKTIIVDVVQLTSSMLPFLGPAAKFASGSTSFVQIAQAPGLWINVCQFALDSAAAIMMSVIGYEKLQKELAKPELQGDDKKAERQKHIILFIAELVQAGMIIGISAKSVHGAYKDHHAPKLAPSSRAKVNDETADILSAPPHDAKVRFEWVENGTKFEATMTKREALDKLAQPGVTKGDLDAVITTGAPTAPTKRPDPSFDEEMRLAAMDMANAESAFAARKAEAEARMKAGRDWVKDLESSGQIVVRPGEVSTQLIQDITLLTNREVGLYRMADKRRILTLGGAHSSLVPEGKVRRLILHTHPSGTMHFSDEDVLTLLHSGKDARGQLTSVLITPHRAGAPADAKRMNVGDARRERATPDKPWFAEPSALEKEAADRRAKRD